MGKASNTPGPWSMTGFDGGRLAEVRVDGKVACLVHSFSKKATVEDVANLHLIAAAPELLDAIITALPYVETAEDDPAYKPGSVAKVVKQMRAAIAKATGEAA